MTIPRVLRFFFCTVVFLPLMWATPALALTCTLTIEPPRLWTDNHPAVLADIAGYIVYVSSCKACIPESPLTAFAINEVGDPARPVLVIPGCQRRLWWWVSAVDQFGGEGLLSPPFFLKR